MALRSPRRLGTLSSEFPALHELVNTQHADMTTLLKGYDQYRTDLRSQLEQTSVNSGTVFTPSKATHKINPSPRVETRDPWDFGKMRDGKFFRLTIFLNGLEGVVGGVVRGSTFVGRYAAGKYEWCGWREKALAIWTEEGEIDKQLLTVGGNTWRIGNGGEVFDSALGVKKGRVGRLAWLGHDHRELEAVSRAPHAQQSAFSLTKPEDSDSRLLRTHILNGVIFRVTLEHFDVDSLGVPGVLPGAIFIVQYIPYGTALYLKAALRDRTLLTRSIAAGLYSATGWNNDIQQWETHIFGNGDPMDCEISLWGRVFTFNGEGDLFLDVHTAVGRVGRIDILDNPNEVTAHGHLSEIGESTCYEFQGQWEDAPYTTFDASVLRQPFTKQYLVAPQSWSAVCWLKTRTQAPRCVMSAYSHDLNQEVFTLRVGEGWISVNGVGQTANIQLDTWHHVCVVCEAALWRLYVDGTPAFTLQRDEHPDVPSSILGGRITVFVGQVETTDLQGIRCGDAWDGLLADTAIIQVPFSLGDAIACAVWGLSSVSGEFAAPEPRDANATAVTMEDKVALHNVEQYGSISINSPIADGCLCGSSVAAFVMDGVVHVKHLANEFEFNIHNESKHKPIRILALGEELVVVYEDYRMKSFDVQSGSPKPSALQWGTYTEPCLDVLASPVGLVLLFKTHVLFKSNNSAARCGTLSAAAVHESGVWCVADGGENVVYFPLAEGGIWGQPVIKKMPQKMANIACSNNNLFLSAVDGTIFRLFTNLHYSIVHEAGVPVQSIAPLTYLNNTGLLVLDERGFLTLLVAGESDERASKSIVLRVGPKADLGLLCVQGSKFFVAQSFKGEDEGKGSMAAAAFHLTRHPALSNLIVRLGEDGPEGTAQMQNVTRHLDTKLHTSRTALFQSATHSLKIPAQDDAQEMRRFISRGHWFKLHLFSAAYPGVQPVEFERPDDNADDDTASVASDRSSLTSTASFIMDANATGLGAMQPGMSYVLRYNGKVYEAFGWNTARKYFGTWSAKNADPHHSEISLWGKVLHYTDNGRVYDKSGFIVGQLGELRPLRPDSREVGVVAKYGGDLRPVIANALPPYPYGDEPIDENLGRKITSGEYFRVTLFHVTPPRDGATYKEVLPGSVYVGQFKDGKFSVFGYNKEAGGHAWLMNDNAEPSRNEIGIGRVTFVFNDAGHLFGREQKSVTGQCGEVELLPEGLEAKLVFAERH